MEGQRGGRQDDDCRGRRELRGHPVAQAHEVGADLRGQAIADIFKAAAPRPAVDVARIFASKIVDVTIALAMAERETIPERAVAIERTSDAAAQVERIVGANITVSPGAELVLRALGDDRYGAGRRVATEQGALRPLQHFNSRDI